MYNDLTFFTNKEEQTLLDRFNKILRNSTQYFDVLVGYFRTSGFYNLYESMEDIERIRILVGINADIKTIELIDKAKNEQIKLNLSTKEIRDEFTGEIINEFEESEDSEEVEKGAIKFIEFIKSGKLEIRAYPYDKIHAKVYIMRKDQKVSEDFGKVITGSSNFSQAGFKDNLEFNVELKDNRDVKYALARFNELWSQSVDITDVYEDTIPNTWIKEDITPYELYLKFLYEYFKEEINHDKGLMIKKKYIPDGFVEYQYQKEAVIDAKKKLEAYGGVFISDVVGLGKTYICALLAQQLEGRKLIVCPPPLVDYWDETFKEFNQVATVVSLGKLDDVLDKDTSKYDYVFIDEAHRFRNENTDNYKKLHEICHSKKIILISATPLNNYPKDIASQLYLFEKRTNSNLSVKNLEKFFREINSRIKKYEKGSQEYIDEIKAVSEEIREKILQEIMVRRTRKDIIENYPDDVEKQGLKFPELETPRKLIYQFDKNTEEVFNETLSVITKLKYARYSPLTYLKNPTKAQKSLMTGQMNMTGFMRSMLVKRLESSFHAFKNTLKRFIDSYTRFINMYEDGIIWISKKNINDLIDAADDEALMDLYEEDKAQKFFATDFREEFYDDIYHDMAILQKLNKKWETVKSDPKLSKFLTELTIDEILMSNKLIIFTEAEETAVYLKENLLKIYGDTVIQYSSKSSKALKKKIEENFDPKVKKPKDDIRILITTDVLAEGVNLHRANVIINYDLPWNPTRVMQRVGRINRVGSKYQNIFVYNFFPTSQGEDAISLEANIIGKIQAFHNTLGDDIQYLSEVEEVNSYGLYKVLNDKEAIEGKEEVKSVLPYLSFIRKIRDENPKLFNKIKKLPKKSRTSKVSKYVNNRTTITFFKKGLLRKMYLANDFGVKEINFFDMVDLIQAEEQEKRQAVEKLFYNYLDKNKSEFYSDLNKQNEEEDEIEITGKSASFIKLIKALYREDCFTDEELQYLEKIEEAVKQGAIVRAKVNEIYKKVQGKSPIEILNVLEDEMPDTYLKNDNISNSNTNVKPVTILSEYLIESGEE
ncbi:helicase-related protein [Clostridium sp. UBA1353]|uniref:helicase-related protein n=1 Tax=Clostridium sp. UBA1353 TaxID=1946347 RepID=UPI003217BC71